MMELFLALCVYAQEPPKSLEQVPLVQPLQFSVTHDGSAGESIDGRVYIMLTKGKLPLIGGPNWFNAEPFYALDVVQWEAGTPLVLGEKADSMEPMTSLQNGEWKAVAVFRKQNDRSKLTVPGGLYSDPVVFNGSGESVGTIALAINKPVPERDWALHKNLRLDEKRSSLLSDFLGHDVQHGACVIVPDNYDPTRAEPYPVMYWIGGFGSDHYGGRFMKMMFTGSDYDDQICRVILNAQAYTGHHVFTDSANNGPRMTALLEEWIPYLEETYNLGGSGDKRFLAGHSSGGWTALWLQVKYPDFFGGAWALAPDPIDFHYFQTCDLYEENANMYVDAAGTDRPIARMGAKPVLFAKDFVAMDDVLKDGGQISSFEAVFSPKGTDGRPMHMFDRATGAVIPEVADYWKQYDIRIFLEENWETLAPKLSGKINIIAGGMDTFYLEDAVIAMNEFFEAKEFDAMVRVMEGGDHGSVFRAMVIREMDEYIAQKLGLLNIQEKASKPKR
ncbi:MAG: alpha/beta hydrolase-fold protein [Phycisphaerales bacterium]